MPNIDSIKFDMTNCGELLQSAPEGKLWMNDEYGMAHLLRFSGTVEWPFDLTDVEGARRFYGDQCASAGGVMLSMDVFEVEKIEVLRGIFKYRSPEPQSLAMMFVGILWIPFTNMTYQLNVEALERGTTGIREATVMALDPEKFPDPSVLQRCPWPQAEPDAEPVQVSSMEEMFQRMRESKLHQLPSDDRQFDDMYPQHPLSLVRKRLDMISRTLKIDKNFWETLKPFRLRRN